MVLGFELRVIGFKLRVLGFEPWVLGFELLVLIRFELWVLRVELQVRVSLVGSFLIFFYKKHNFPKLLVLTPKVSPFS